jgi:hypothetical protein
MAGISNRLRPHEIAALVEPLTTAVIALRLGTATEQHLSDLCAAVHISYRIAEAVARHCYLLPHLTKASDALIAQGQGEPFDVDAIDNGISIFRALIIATPRPKVAKIMTRAAAAASVVTPPNGVPNEAGPIHDVAGHPR